MKHYFVILFATFILALAGCSQSKDFLAKTTAYHTADGTYFYESTKNQEGFEASAVIDPVTGKVTGFSIKTKATTPESVVAAVLEARKAELDTMNKVLDMAAKAAKAAPVPVP